MQPLGSAALVAAYHERLFASHDADLSVQVLDMSERLLGSAVLVDGQIDIQDAGSAIRRTASLTLSDPDRSLGLDGGTPWQEMPVSAQRLVRVRHTLDVPGFGAVTATPFIGVVGSVQRDGSTVQLELQDKTALCVTGTMPLKVGKGSNAVNAIRTILATRYGERHFRLPAGIRTRLPWAVNVGWKDDASGWVACQRIAHLLGMQLFYSCDGYVTLRDPQTRPVITFDQGALTQVPQGASDFLAIINYARVTVGQSWRSAQLLATDPLSPASLGRDGVPRYLPSVEELGAPTRPGQKAKVKVVEAYNTKLRSTLASAQARANAATHRQTDSLTWAAVPVFHVDTDDLVLLVTDQGAVSVRLSSGSIPLGTGGDMSGGIQRAVRRRGVRHSGISDLMPGPRPLQPRPHPRRPS